MGDEATKVTSDNTVPGSTLSGIELDELLVSKGGGVGLAGIAGPDLFLNVLCDVLQLVSMRLKGSMQSQRRVHTFSMWYFSIASIAGEVSRYSFFPGFRVPYRDQ